jgi:hypothetical protein
LGGGARAPRRPAGGPAEGRAREEVHHPRCAPPARGVTVAHDGIDRLRLTSLQARPARRLPRGPRLAQARLMPRGPGAHRAGGHVGISYAWRARNAHHAYLSGREPPNLAGTIFVETVRVVRRSRSAVRFTFRLCSCVAALRKISAIPASAVRFPLERPARCSRP